MEHAQPLDRAFPWRTVALAASVLALGAGSVVALLDRPAGTRPEPGSRRVQKGPARPPLRPRSRISVLVLNGNGVSGAAGTVATNILARGYRHAIPTDAPSLNYVRSLVLFRPGWQREAERLGRDARIPTVAPLDGRVAPAYAHVPLIVILGAK
ncbi:MAG: LytR C-terminal domain-containing protein [Gaiellaceae bacterium]